MALHDTLSSTLEAPDSDLKPTDEMRRSLASSPPGRRSFLDGRASISFSRESGGGGGSSPSSADPPARRTQSADGGSLSERRPRRPPSIKIFKENDRHTRRAIRKEYSLYCDGHPSRAECGGLEDVLDAASSRRDPAAPAGAACGVSLHVAKISCLQTARVLHDAQIADEDREAAGDARLFEDLSGGVAARVRRAGYA